MLGGYAPADQAIIATADRDLQARHALVPPRRHSSTRRRFQVRSSSTRPPRATAMAARRKSPRSRLRAASVAPSMSGSTKPTAGRTVNSDTARLSINCVESRSANQRRRPTHPPHVASARSSICSYDEPRNVSHGAVADILARAAVMIALRQRVHVEKRKGDDVPSPLAEAIVARRMYP